MLLRLGSVGGAHLCITKESGIIRATRRFLQARIDGRFILSAACGFQHIILGLLGIIIGREISVAKRTGLVWHYSYYLLRLEGRWQTILLISAANGKLLLLPFHLDLFSSIHELYLFHIIVTISGLFSTTSPCASHDLIGGCR